jgi:mono/diheme cytochrome c family protein
MRLHVTVTIVLFAAACGGSKSAPDTSSVAPSPPSSAPSPAASNTVADGATIYERCTTCHQANGEGVAGAFPPLAGSEWINAADPSAAIRVILHGLQGPITVHGKTVSSLMPAYGTGVPMSDAEVAAVLTYERSSWGNKAAGVTAQMVAKERAATADQQGPWSVDQLKPLLK